MDNKKLQYIPKDQRKKILIICDDLRANSGVSNVGKEVILGTAHHYNFVCMGGAITHPDEGKRFDLSEDTDIKTGLTDSSVVMYPVNGYGNPTQLKGIINIEKPDAIFLITDPRYFVWLFQIENEIRKTIPIVYLQIWDSSYVQPLWNLPFYESCDLLMAISKQTLNTNKVVLSHGDVPFIEIK